MKSFFLVFILALMVAACTQERPAVQIPQCDTAVDKDAAKEEAQRIEAICQTAANLQVIKAGLREDLWAIDFRIKVLELQNIYSITTLLLVVVVFGAGLLIAIIEFKLGRSSRNIFKFGSDGVELSSKLVGIIVLVISLGFTYLFLEKVYPVREMTLSPTDSNQPKGYEK